MNKKQTIWPFNLGALFFVVLIVLCFIDPFNSEAQYTSGWVKRVLDGDTIELVSGEQVRYIGVDSPETVDPYKPVECYGREAAKYNTELVLGKYVEVEIGKESTDSFGRTLGYVYVTGQTKQMVNAELVINGYAVSDPVGENTKYLPMYEDLERIAQVTDIGLWRHC